MAIKWHKQYVLNSNKCQAYSMKTKQKQKVVIKVLMKCKKLVFTEQIV